MHREMGVNLRHIRFLVVILASLTVISGCQQKMDNTDKIVLKTRMDTISYIIGLDYGIGIREERIDANKLAIYKGLSDGLAGTSVLTDSAKNEIIDEFNELLKARLEKEGMENLKKNKLEGKKFLEENIDVEGVVQLPGGLQYKVLKEGTGPKPQATDSVIVHYRAMFINRDVFDMSYDRGPAGFKLNEVTKGLSQGIRLMKEGAIYELYIPPELAYGDQTFAKTIPAGSTLIYTIELIDVIKLSIQD
jgi:FKBP-type peptidyl-prolyl cis-trans isomerase FklB